MTEHEKEVEALKERVKYLEGVIEGMSRGMVSRPQPLPPVYFYGPIQQPTTGTPTYYWPQYKVTC